MNGIRLRRLDEAVLERLLAAAVAEADPGEVMPPVAGPPGWTPARVEAFRAFHRDARTGPTTMFAIETDGTVVGMIRLTRLGEDGDDGDDDGDDGDSTGTTGTTGATGATDGAGAAVAETGLWLGRAWRGRGIGTAAVRALLREAALLGVRTVVADTTAGNAAALRVLRRNGAALTPHEPGSIRVDAVIPVPAADHRYGDQP